MFKNKYEVVPLQASNVKYYENLGYTIPRRKAKYGLITYPKNTKLKVRVGDIPFGSHFKVIMICDECTIEFNRAIKEVYRARKIHKNKDLCLKCANEDKNKNKNDGEMVRDCFVEKGLIPLFAANEYKDRTHKLPFMCLKHKSKGVLYKTYKDLKRSETGCKYCAAIESGKKISKKMLKNFQNIDELQWEGQLCSISEYLRASLKEWKERTMKYCDYKCVITGERFDDIHHLHGFALIVKEVFLNTKLLIKEKMIDYSEDELEILKNECLRLHDFYGYGVCLRKDVHKLFHSVYGNGCNTKEQFEEFKNKFITPVPSPEHQRDVHGKNSICTQIFGQ